MRFKRYIHTCIYFSDTVTSYVFQVEALSIVELMTGGRLDQALSESVSAYGSIDTD